MYMFSWAVCIIHIFSHEVWGTLCVCALTHGLDGAILAANGTVCSETGEKPGLVWEGVAPEAPQEPHMYPSLIGRSPQCIVHCWPEPAVVQTIQYTQSYTTTSVHNTQHWESRNLRQQQNIGTCCPRVVLGSSQCACFKGCVSYE